MRPSLRILGLLLALLVCNTVQAQLTGTITIPSGTYPDLTTAVNALNSQGVGTGGVVINISSGNPQSAPAGGYQLGSATLNASISATKPITINGNGNIVTANTGTSTTVDGIFILMGVDYVTINGLNLSENAANTTATAAMEWGYALVNLNSTAPFDGCQNNTIQNCTVTLNRTIATPSSGIYMNHITATSNTALTITATTDLHNNNKFYGNTVNNVVNGIYIYGYAAPSPYTLYDQNNEVGGATAATGNTITNFAGTNFTGVGGITMVYQNNASIANNTINNITSGGVSAVGAVWGIYPYGTNSTFTVNNNSVNLTGASINTAYYLYGIYTNALGTNITTNNNTVTLAQAAGSAAVPMYGFFLPNGNNVTANSNNVSITQSLSATMYGIYSTATGNVVISNNTLKEATSAAITGTCYMVYAGGTALSETISNNKLDNITLNTTGSVYLIYASNSTPAVTITGNYINGGFTRTASGTTYCVYNFGSPGSGTSNVSGNNFSNITTTGTGSIYGLYYFTASGHNHNFTFDTLSNWSSGGGAAQFYGIYMPSGNANTVANNYINNINTTYNGTCYTIYGSASSTININNNTLTNISNGGSPLYGLYLSGGTTANLFNNQIRSLSATTSTSATAYGLYISSGTAVNVYNNMISDIKAPVASGNSPVYGMYFSGGTTVKAFHNTVFLNPTSTGASFGATGVYYSSGITSFDFRNNIINVSANPVGSGYVVALNRSFGTAGIAPSNLATTTNGNIYYAPNAANSYLYAEGTSTPLVNAYNLTNDPNFNTGGCAGTSLFKAFMAPRSTSDFSENNLVQIGTTGTFAPAGSSYAKNNGVSTANPAVTTDLNGVTRTLPPDAGALQFSGTALLDIAAPIISYTALPPSTYCTTGPTLTAAISDASGVNTTTNAPRLYYRKTTEANAFGTYPASNVSSFNGWKYVTAANTTSPFQFTIDYSKLTAPIAPGDTIVYFVAAQDNAATVNVGAANVAFPAGYCPPSVNLSTTAGPVQATPAPDRYYILAQPALPGVTPATSTICPGGSSVLTASSASSSVVATIGTGTATSGTTGYPTPYGNYWGSAHDQYLIPASELQAAGLSAGNLTSLSFNLASGYTYAALQGFTVKIAHTSLTSMPASFQSTGFTTVYTAATSYTPPAVAGWAPLAFSTPFPWDGVSNIIVDVSFVNCTTCNNTSSCSTTYTSNGSVNRTATSYTSTYSVYYDGNCSITSYTPSGTFLTTQSSSRPNMQLTGSSVQPINWVPVTGLFKDAALTTAMTASDTNKVVYASPAATTTYNTVNMFTGCQSAPSPTGATVTVLPAPPTNITVSGATTFCAGATVSVPMTAPAGYSYQWRLNGSPITGATSVSYTATAAGAYTVTTTNTASGCSATTPTPVNVVVNPLPPATITAATTTTFCTGGSVVLNAPLPPAGTTYTYVWNNNGSPITGATGQTYSATTTGNYTVKVTNAATGCFATTTTATVVTVGPPPAAPVTPAGPLAVCQGSSVQIKTNNAGGLSYQWLLNGSAAPTTAGPNNDSVYNAPAAGTYTVTVSSGPGCSTTSAGVVVSVNPLPAATVTASSAPTTFCQGSSVTLTGNTGTGVSYQWYNGNTLIPGATSTTYSANASGTYRMIVTNLSTLCANSSNVVPVTVNPLPVATITPATSPNLCPGGSVVLNANSGTGLSYQWYQNTTPINNATAASLTANATGSYTVQVTNTATGCANTSSAQPVVVNPAPPTTVSPSGSVGVCTGSTVSLTGPPATPGNTYLYQWKNPANIAGATTSSYTTGTAGTYTLQVTNAATGCTATSAPVTVTLLALPSVSVTPNTPSTGCDSVVLTGNATNVSYQWKLNGSGISGANNATHAAVTTGTYSLTVTDNNGCSATSGNVSITVNQSPSASITYATPLVFCEGGAVVLNGITGNNLTYEWRTNNVPIPGATNYYYITSQSGIYSLKVTNTATGCARIGNGLTVVVNPLPTPVITYNNGVLSTGTYMMYKWFYNQQPIGSATGKTYTPAQNGAYAVSVTDSNGCTNISPVYFVNTVGIGNSPVPAAMVKVYPNPTNGIVHVDAPVKTRLVVRDVSGKTVASVEGKEIRLDELADGMYLLYISNMEGQLIKAEKITKTTY